jgi:predicted GNAT family acetyltransferase
VQSLDRPVWASLSTCHAALAEGDPLARRFVRDVNLFASSCDESPDALSALTRLVRADESVFLLQVPRIVIPPGLVAIREALGVQMLATGRVPFEVSCEDILTLGEADAPEMLALARLTEPGPFLRRTRAMGTFLGIRIGGRLVAMAGERMRFPGYTEVSGVCTHPEFRGRGMARLLSAAVAAGIVARGEQPFLHAWKSNHAALALYHGLGFEVRTEVHVAELTQP